MFQSVSASQGGYAGYRSSNPCTLKYWLDAYETFFFCQYAICFFIHILNPFSVILYIVALFCVVPFTVPNAHPTVYTSMFFTLCICFSVMLFCCY